MPLRVAFVVPYPIDQAPGQRFRFEQWLGLLPPGAVEAEFYPLFDSKTYARLYSSGGTMAKVSATIKAFSGRISDVVRAGRADVAFVYRECFPFGPALFERVLSLRVPVVFDFDDAIFLGATSEANAFVSRLKMPGKVSSTVAGAAVTTVGNEYLANFARRYSDFVRVIPTTLDITKYRPVSKPPQRMVRVGWSGSRTTSPHLLTIRSALERALKELPIEIHVIGDPSVRLIDSNRVVVKAWSRETEVRDVASFDIGLMPLPDDEWSKGKCGFKALLYMAMGVPPIVSPIGVNPQIVVDGANGLHAWTDDEWVDAIAQLVEDEDRRRTLGGAARETVVEEYSGQRWAPIFLETLHEAASA